MPFTGLSVELYVALLRSPDLEGLYAEIIRRQIETELLRSALEDARRVSEDRARELVHRRAQLAYFEQSRGGGARAADVEMPDGEVRAVRLDEPYAAGESESLTGRVRERPGRPDGFDRRLRRKT